MISEGGLPVTARGICWGTSPNPTIADNKTIDGTGASIFSSSLTGLVANTYYYVRSYATNSLGTEYGNELSFYTGTVTDIDLNVYGTVTIGTQTWLAENLKATKFSDGLAIPLVADNAAWAGLSGSGYCWYNNDINNKDDYGALYNF